MQSQAATSKEKEQLPIHPYPAAETTRLQSHEAGSSNARPSSSVFQIEPPPERQIALTAENSELKIPS
ncbi:hypothetical protein K505DRAFT_380887 [Melanomma pulvis-pyrius CBS 109.77]|uniref:Uncharacterized protein n=1 Tax=Melanomma pulvis-pyrius CBS 109.77 TaxID=1314802 RepID=A0A6A6WNB7_9PLEO|nr:hypothetical protein K505DRAFT_380887 [Melanomma pulvis-pyrius CBS 109.77]